MSRLIPAIALRVADEAIDRVLRNIQERISQIQGIALIGGKDIENIALPDATDIWVSHKLGRPARIVLSPPRGGATTTGRITDRTELSGVNADRREYVVLRASGWGTTIYVDARVW